MMYSDNGDVKEMMAVSVVITVRLQRDCNSPNAFGIQCQFLVMHCPLYAVASILSQCYLGTCLVIPEVHLNERP